jgi:5-methylthioadenosine/S-adenosylhomocysteine deaminase
MTMVDGRILYENGEYLTLDREKVMFDAKQAVKRLYGGA